MKKRIVFLTLLIGIGLFLLPLSQGYAQMGPSMMGQRGYGQWNYCPYCGQQLTPGPYGMGPGMMGPGMMGPGMMGPGQQGQQKTLTEEDAKAILQNYLMSTRNPNLALGKIEDKGNGFEAEIVTKKEGALVDKIFVDRYTGWMRSIY